MKWIKVESIEKYILRRIEFYEHIKSFIAIKEIEIFCNGHINALKDILTDIKILEEPKDD